MRTDYDKIAEKYDEDRKSRGYNPHGWVRERLVAGASGLAVLELGCGPGRWLAVQMEHFKGCGVRWVGIDPFAGMIALARRNAPGAELIQCGAENLPFPDASFDLVTSIVSFHHFLDKERALDHVARVLRPGGQFNYGDINPWGMPKWWPHVFFPEGWEVDMQWFWPVDRLIAGLERRGLVVEHTLSHDKPVMTAAGMLADAERRTLSQLASIDDAAYERGMARLRAFAAGDPDRQHPDEFSWFSLIARKPA